MHVARHSWTRRRSGAVSPDAGVRAAGEHVLFVGPPGVGKRRFAIELATRCCARNRRRQRWSRAASANRAALFAAGNHPDLEVVGLPAGQVDAADRLFIGDDEHRNQEGLCHRIALQAVFRAAQSRDRRRCRPFQHPQRKLLAEDARGAAAERAVDSDRHEPQPAVADDSVAVASGAISAAGKRNGRPNTCWIPAWLPTAIKRLRASRAQRRQRRAGDAIGRSGAVGFSRSSVCRAECRRFDSVRLARRCRRLSMRRAKSRRRSAIGCGSSSALRSSFIARLLRNESAPDSCACCQHSMHA